MVEQTLSIIKPNGVKKNAVGKIIDRFESQGLKVAAAKLVKLDQAKAEGFYAEHKARPFFGELVSFMSSGPVLIMVLEGPNAIMKNRDIMGATDPKKAAPGTIRADFGDNMGENTVHGSDSATSAHREIRYFFDPKELVNASLT
jgi:nucleoside-diphosphate kinase